MNEESTPGTGNGNRKLLDYASAKTAKDRNAVERSFKTHHGGPPGFQTTVQRLRRHPFNRKFRQ